MPTLASNRRARHDYQILETIEAGIVLSGAEVKSAKAGQITINHAYARVGRDGSAWLVGCHIAPYPPAAGNNIKYDATRERRLLLKRSQLRSLIGTLKQPGLTFLPLSVYTKGSFVKLEVGVGRGKRLHDKRATIKKREVEREIRSHLKRG